MKNVSRLFYSLVVAFVMVVVLSIDCSGIQITTTRIELPASESTTKPTTYVYEDKPNTQYSITTKGILAGDKLIITIFTGVPNHDNKVWGLLNRWGKENTLTEDQYLELVQLSKTFVHIEGYCGMVNFSNATDISDIGTTLTCKKGKKLTVELYSPSKENKDDANKKGALSLTTVRM